MLKARSPAPLHDGDGKLSIPHPSDTLRCADNENMLTLPAACLTGIICARRLFDEAAVDDAAGAGATGPFRLDRGAKPGTRTLGSHLDHCATIGPNAAGHRRCRRATC